MNRERVEQQLTAARVRLMEARYLLEREEGVDYAEVGALCHESVYWSMQAYLTACGVEDTRSPKLTRLLDKMLEIDITCDPLIEPAVELEGLRGKIGGAAAAKRAFKLAAGFNEFFIQRLRSEGLDPATPTSD